MDPNSPNSPMRKLKLYVSKSFESPKESIKNSPKKSPKQILRESLKADSESSQTYRPGEGLGGAFALLASGQQRSSNLIKSLDREYEDRYYWKPTETATIPRATPLLSYSDCWDASAILGNINTSIAQAAAAHSSAKTKAGVKTDVQTDVKTDVKADVIAYVKTDFKADAKADVTPSGPETVAQSVDKNSAKAARKKRAKSPVQTPQVEASDVKTPAQTPRVRGKASIPKTPYNIPETYVGMDIHMSPIYNISRKSKSQLFQAQTSTSDFRTPAQNDKIFSTNTVPVTGGHVHLGDGLSPLKSPKKTVDSGTGYSHDIQDARFSSAVASNPSTFDIQPKTRRQDGSDASAFMSTTASDPTIVYEVYKQFPYPLAQHQPWEGMTCYNAPMKDRNDIRPFYMTSQAGKRSYLQYKLQSLHAQDKKYPSLQRGTPGTAQDYVHIFVDLSNIIIGFYDVMKMKRQLPVDSRVKAPEFSFDNFHLLLARDRKVEKMVLGGSLGWNAKRPKHMEEAEKLGYEMNIMSRVTKVVVPRSGGRKSQPNSAGKSSAASGTDSCDESFAPTTKVGEQGVDELLHLKILESVVDLGSAPGTIILATGDGAQAEFSAGFKAQVDRALRLGWRVELYSWRHSLSAAWKSTDFTQEWVKQFRFIALDDYAEELYGWWLESQ